MSHTPKETRYLQKVPKELSHALRLKSESSYRRGFQQGANAAIEAMAKGARLSYLEHWVGMVLEKWCQTRDSGSGKPPLP
jgi:hypothetical protein